ncbi:MAG: hypothetical protein ACKO6N_10295 [Myxococcota bacterium]
MHSKTHTLQKLEQAAAGMNTSNHERFMQDALECLAQGGSVQDAVELLERLENTAFTAREEIEKAHKEVLDWLLHTVHQSLAPTEADLRWQLGWLRRLARAQQSTQTERARISGGDGGGAGTRTAYPSGQRPGQARADHTVAGRTGAPSAAPYTEGTPSQSFGTLQDKLAAIKLESSSSKT